MTVYPHLPKIGILDFLANISRKRFNFRITTSRFTFFTMIARSQQMEGITSQVYDENGKPTNFHYPMWDLEGTSLETIKKTLKKVQRRYHLSDIHLTTDNNGKTFRGWCFSVVTFDTYLKILIDCGNIVDYGFLFYTFKRKEATLRLKPKRRQTIPNMHRCYRVVFCSFSHWNHETCSLQHWKREKRYNGQFRS